MLNWGTENDCLYLLIMATPHKQTKMLKLSSTSWLQQIHTMCGVLK